jgi:chromatin segregation and condensation protein Rec8/ScpA/Scc1 (kleisin family)
LAVTLPEPLDRDHRVSPRTVTMEEKSRLILDVVREQTGVEFTRLLEPFREKIHGVMTFLAGLELSRRRRILLRQAQPFHELWFYPRDEEDASGVEEESGSSTDENAAVSDENAQATPSPTEDR